MQPPPATSITDLVETYRKAELRLRQALLGDGVYSGGLVRGDEGRGQVTRELGRMRETVAALRELGEAGTADAARAEVAEARAAELEEMLARIASTKTRRRKSA